MTEKPPAMLEKLDSLDRRLLWELDRDGRVSVSKLARKCHRNVQTIRYRVFRLEEQGYIKGYYAVADFSPLGVMAFRFYLQLATTQPDAEKQMLDYLINEPRVWFLGKVSGSFHIVVSFWARSTQDFRLFWPKFLSRFGNHISHSHVDVMTSYTEFGREYLRPGENGAKKDFAVLTGGEPIQFDETDVRILQLLSKDGRASTILIARRLKLSVDVVRYRIRRLEKNGILLGTRANVNYRQLGRDYFKIDIFLADRSQRDRIRNYLIQLPETVYTEESTAASDIEFDIEVPNGLSGLTGFMNDARNHFPRQIGDYRYYNMQEIIKNNFVPEMSILFSEKNKNHNHE